jgi:hypothetical protein
MSESRRQLLSIGVLFIIIVVAIIAYAANLIGPWLNIFPTIFIMFGAWELVMAFMRAQSPQKYERPPFSTLEMGIIIMAFGVAWLVWRTNWLYSLAVLILVLGAIAIASALRRKKP